MNPCLLLIFNNPMPTFVSESMQPLTIKSCPKCSRTYSDNSISFCFDDGSLLSAPHDPEATLVLPAAPYDEADQVTQVNTQFEPYRLAIDKVKAENPHLKYVSSQCRGYEDGMIVISKFRDAKGEKVYKRFCVDDNGTISPY